MKNLFFNINLLSGGFWTIPIRSFVKLYGPPVRKAIQALEKTSIPMAEVCIINTLIVNTDPSVFGFSDVQGTR